MRVHCSILPTRPDVQKLHAGVLWNVTGCSSVRMGLGLNSWAGPQRQDQDSARAALPGTLAPSRPGVRDLLHLSPHSLGHPHGHSCCPLAVPATTPLLCRTPLPTPPTLVPLTPAHPLPLCLDTISAGNPWLTPSHHPDPHNPCVHLCHSNSTMHCSYLCTCFSPLRSGKHLGVV